MFIFVYFSCSSSIGSCFWSDDKGTCRFNNGSTTRCVWNDQQHFCRMESIEEIMNLRPPKFMSNYASPCWMEQLDNSKMPTQSQWLNQNEHLNKDVLNRHQPILNVYKDQVLYRERDGGIVQRVRCLPYFYVIGVAKSGTTDLFNRMKQHPYIENGVQKELHYWARSRFGRHFAGVTVYRPKSLIEYSELFDGAAQKSQSVSVLYEKDSRSYEYHPIRIGEASVSTLHDNHQWRCLKENVCGEEPRLITPSYIMHIQPQARFIAILRDPISRLYSDYYFFIPNLHSPEDFHSRVVKSLTLFEDCLFQNTLRHCAYDMDLFQNSPIDLKLGLYAIYISDWLKVVPRNQMYFVPTQIWSSDRHNELGRILNFLGLESNPSLGQTEKVANVNTNESRPPMFQETKMLLKRFYTPYNQKLSKLLRSDNFLYGYS